MGKTCVLNPAGGGPWDDILNNLWKKDRQIFGNLTVLSIFVLLI